MEQVTETFTAKAEKEYAEAGGVAEEVLASARTITALNGQELSVQRYDGYLARTYVFGVKKGVMMGISMAVFFFLIFSRYFLKTHS